MGQNLNQGGQIQTGENEPKGVNFKRVLTFLLRGLTIDRPNQVWAMDITYIPMARGFVYLVGPE